MGGAASLALVLELQRLAGVGVRELLAVVLQLLEGPDAELLKHAAKLADAGRRQVRRSRAVLGKTALLPGVLGRLDRL